MKKLKIVSPLRYPGGKSAFVPYIAAFLQEHLLAGCTLVEPYAGGASVSLSLLSMGLINGAILAEADPLLYAFWRCVFYSTSALCKLISETPVNIQTWFELQDYLHGQPLTKYGIRKSAMAGLFLNRMNFSGILHAKPIGGLSQSSKYKIDCRFNKDRIVSLIMDISRFRDRIEVVNQDALDLLTDRSALLRGGSCLIYIDPPYYEQGKRLYRHYYQDKDHIKLAKHLHHQDCPWLVSIDSHPRIRELYMDRFLLDVKAKYTAKSKRHADELLVSNRQLLEIEH